jgi:hypothetical protein
MEVNAPWKGEGLPLNPFRHDLLDEGRVLPSCVANYKGFVNWTTLFYALQNSQLPGKPAH